MTIGATMATRLFLRYMMLVVILSMLLANSVPFALLYPYRSLNPCPMSFMMERIAL